MSKVKQVFCPLILLLSLAATFISQPTPDDRTVRELYSEVENYSTDQRKMLASQGKRYDAAARDEIESDKRSLAKKYAAVAAARPDLAEKDIYFLARLYSTADDDKKTLATMRRFIDQYPPDTKSDLIQSALGYVVILASQMKQMPVAENAFLRWQTGGPAFLSQQPALQDYLATGYLKDGQYEQAIRHAQAAFDLLKTFPAKGLQEKRTREQVYMNLVEVLALGYKRNKNADQALNVLAEARARSFTLPSANLYRKVMNFVEGGGFSEKKLMQKVESYSKAEPAPEMKMVEWIGQESVSLEELRGKVVLLDFWATWCGPCIATFPRLREWHKKYSGNDFVLVGVTQYYGEQEGKRLSSLQEIEYLRSFKEKHKLPYGFAVAAGGEASTKYGINAYPSTVLLDRNGVVRYIGIGSGIEESENLEAMIKVVMKETARPGQISKQ